MSRRYPLDDMSPAERALYLAARQRVEFTRIRDENGQPTDDLIEIQTGRAGKSRRSSSCAVAGTMLSIFGSWRSTGPTTTATPSNWSS